MALALLAAAPPDQGWLLLACTVLGLGSWSGVRELSEAMQG